MGEGVIMKKCSDSKTDTLYYIQKETKEKL